MILKKLKIAQKMFLGFGIITVFMLLVLGYNYINFTKESSAVELNLHTYNVIRESDSLLISLINMETGARGFALTGQEDFLEPYNQGKIDIQSHYNNIKQLTADNFHQQDRLADFKSNYDTWLQWESSQLVDGRRKVSAGQAKMEDIIAIVQSGKGKAQMDNLRKILDNIVKEEQGLLQTRHNDLINMEKQTAIVLSIGGALAIFLTIIISIFVIRMVVNPVNTVTNTFKEISEGDADLEVRLDINSKDELGDMARYFNTFMTKLKELILENNNQSWLKTGQAEINETLRGEQDIQTLSSSVISYIAKYINAQIGAVYVKTVDDTFRLIGSYAYNRRKNILNEIKIGEGIVGQSALEKQTIIITNVPEDYIKIGSGIGESVPRNIIVVPCLYENEVKCLIEIGSFYEFTDIQMQFIEQISSSIAITINSSEVRLKMKELLNKTMEQAEELQAQQEELRQNNEELEEQTKSLKESEAHLQSQQEELRVINEELEERTKSLELQKNDIYAKNESLKFAQQEIEEKAKALEVSSKYKSEFLANMSHELRTPLNSILVLSQILAEKNDDRPLTEKQIEFAKTIHSSGEDLLKLINDILDLSKVEAGKMDINFENLNLLELAQYVDRSFSHIASKNGVNFKIEIEDGLPDCIISDIQRVQQIVNNLLSNAFKFTHKGRVTMRIYRIENHNNLKFQEFKGNYIGISIADTGIGIPLDKQAIIFEAFKQSDGTTSRKYGGTGLGLSISKDLASILGGSILLESEEGKGSTFTLVLPDKGDKEIGPFKDNSSIDIINLKYKETQEVNKELIENKNITSMHEDDNKYFDTAEKLLLIIEDDINFSNILMELSKEKGYKCLVAQSGYSGISLAAKYKPDAILLDIGLPDISGWNVIQKLKENEATKDIPVHVISGGDDNNPFHKMNNILGYLKKPVTMESLNEAFIKIENNILTSFKKLLIVDENINEFESIADTLSKKDFQVTLLDSGLKAYNLLKTEQFDCLILDLKLKDISGYELLDMLRNEGIQNLQIIIHTEKKLTQEDELELQIYTNSIIIKGTRSTERLVSEVSLFLHDIDSKIEEGKIKTIKSDHEKEDSLNNKKVLVVDDDMRNVFALTSVLEEKGLRVVVGRNGKDAIQKLNENQDIDLILMDIMMPEMDGYTAIRQIRNKEKFQRTPIIAITAKAMKDDRQKCIDAGADDYLTKPIDMDKLTSLLRVWLYK